MICLVVALLPDRDPTPKRHWSNNLTSMYARIASILLTNKQLKSINLESSSFASVNAAAISVTANRVQNLHRAHYYYLRRKSIGLMKRYSHVGVALAFTDRLDFEQITRSCVFYLSSLSLS